MIAPLVLFVFNRPRETRLMLESLRRNALAAQSVLYIFSDAPRVPDDVAKVAAVRQYIGLLSGFRHTIIEYAPVNKGLANSVISGVDAVLKKHGKAIVLEDDLVVSPDFLTFMNQALTLFVDRKDIWSVAGYSPPIALPGGYHSDTFLLKRASSHGWGTWINRWERVDWDVSDFLLFRQNRVARRAFDETGNDMFRTLGLQQAGRTNSWAIRFCYSQFKHAAYTVYPVQSKVQINGYGAGATHTGLADKRHFVSLSARKLTISPHILYNEEIGTAFRKHQDLRSIAKIGFFMRRYGLGYQTARNTIVSLRSCLNSLLKKLSLWLCFN